MDSLYGYKEQFLRPCEVVCGCVRVCVGGGLEVQRVAYNSQASFFSPPSLYNKERRKREERELSTRCGVWRTFVTVLKSICTVMMY